MESSQSNKITLLDGAMGTELQSAGLPQGQLSATWNLEQPEAVIKVHQDYLKAGSQIIFTNTFGVCDPQLIRAGVELAKYAITPPSPLGSPPLSLRGGRGELIQFAASIGPLDSSKLSDAEITRHYFQLISLFLDEGVDMIVLETMINRRETLLATESAFKLSSGKTPLMVLMHVNEKARLPDGTEPGLLAQELEGQGASILGINCSLTYNAVHQALKSIQTHASCELAVKPAKMGHDFKGWLHQFRPLVSYIGGCCGTTPEDISLCNALHLADFLQ